MDFLILPAFYQTLWFKFLWVTALGLVLWGLYRFRLRQVAATMNLRFEERLAERARIARELHDNLLQNIAGVALQLGGLAKIVSTPVAKERLRDLREQAEQWLRAVDGGGTPSLRRKVRQTEARCLRKLGREDEAHAIEQER